LAKKPVITSKPEPTQTYRVKNSLRHDGETYGEDDEVDLTDAQALDLARIGIVHPDPLPEAKPAE